MKPCSPDPIGRRKVAAAAPCSLGTLGRRLPLWMAETTLTFPAVSVEVRVDRSSELSYVAEIAKSKNCVGCIASSSSTPRLTAFGTLNTSRDEQEPAVTVNCRSRMSIQNADALNDARPPIHWVFAPTS